MPIIQIELIDLINHLFPLIYRSAESAALAGLGLGTEGSDMKQYQTRNDLLSNAKTVSIEILNARLAISGPTL